MLSVVCAEATASHEVTEFTARVTSSRWVALSVSSASIAAACPAALEEAERLSTLLDQLLALARTERSAPLADVDVDAAVSDRMEAWRPLAEHTGLRLERDGQPGLTVAAPVGAVLRLDAAMAARAEEDADLERLLDEGEEA